MKKLLIYLLSLCHSLMLSCSGVFAAETLVLKLGGSVGTKYTIESFSKLSDTWEYRWLTKDWAKLSAYNVETTVSVASSTTLSCGMTAQIKDSLKANYNVSYGVTVSSGPSVGMTIPADKIKNYHVKVKAVATTYDTATGYKTATYHYSGNIHIPDKSETYIYVYYK